MRLRALFLSKFRDSFSCWAKLPCLASSNISTRNDSGLIVLRVPSAAWVEFAPPRIRRSLNQTTILLFTETSLPIVRTAHSFRRLKVSFIPSNLCDIDFLHGSEGLVPFWLSTVPCQRTRDTLQQRFVPRVKSLSSENICGDVGRRQSRVRPGNSGPCHCEL